MSTKSFVFSVIMLTLTIWHWFGLEGLSPLPTLATNPSSCYQHFPEWDKVLDAEKQLKEANGIPSYLKQHLLNRFSTLKQRHDSYFNGTAPWCKKFFAHEIKVKQHNEDVVNYNKESTDHSNKVSLFYSECSVVTVYNQQKCQSLADEINANKSKLDPWYKIIETRKKELDLSKNTLDSEAEKINAEWQTLLNKFIADVNNAVTAIISAKQVKDAVRSGQKPPFQPLWDYYQYNYKHNIAKGLVPNEDRCAIQMSMTLGLEPLSGEANLHSLGPTVARKIIKFIKEQKIDMPLKEVTDAEIAKRYYIRAQELANRLKKEWGSPSVLSGTKAEMQLTNKKGVIFIMDAWGNTDHIDVWDSNRIGSDINVPFNMAKEIWFWEISK